MKNIFNKKSNTNKSKGEKEMGVKKYSKCAFAFDVACGTLSVASAGVNGYVTGLAVTNKCNKKVMFLSIPGIVLSIFSAGLSGISIRNGIDKNKALRAERLEAEAAATTTTTDTTVEQ